MPVGVWRLAPAMPPDRRGYLIPSLVEGPCGARSRAGLLARRRARMKARVSLWIIPASKQRRQFSRLVMGLNRRSISMGS